jgi:hypothetical protein
MSFALLWRVDFTVLPHQYSFHREGRGEREEILEGFEGMRESFSNLYRTRVKIALF